MSELIEFIQVVLAGLVFTAVTIGIVGGTVLTHRTYQLLCETGLNLSAIKEELAYRKSEKDREKALDKEFSSFSEGAMVLLDGREYSHYCRKESCGHRKWSHYEPHAKHFAKEDYDRIIQDDKAQEYMDNGDFDALMEKADLLEPKRMKSLANSRLDGFDINSITEKEWDMIHQEYNDYLIYLIKDKSSFNAVLNAVRTDNKDSLKTSILIGSEREKLASMTADDMRVESWEQKFETV